MPSSVSSPYFSTKVCMLTYGFRSWPDLILLRTVPHGLCFQIRLELLELNNLVQKALLMEFPIRNSVIEWFYFEVWDIGKWSSMYWFWNHPTGRFDLVDCLHEYINSLTLHGDDVLAHLNWEISEKWLRRFGYAAHFDARCLKLICALVFWSISHFWTCAIAGDVNVVSPIWRWQTYRMHNLMEALSEFDYFSSVLALFLLCCTMSKICLVVFNYTVLLQVELAVPFLAE